MSLLILTWELGCSIFRGKPKYIHFQAIVDKIKVKMATWKGSLLSIMGRVHLIKSIIHAKLVYLFHVCQWPMNLPKMLDTWIKNSIWSDDIHTKKVCTVEWKHVCLGRRVVLSSQPVILFRKRFFAARRPLHRHFKSSF